MLSELATWLNKGTYEDGVLLYERAIGPGFTLTMLKRGKDDFNRQKLRKGLEAKLAELKAAELTRKATYPPALTRSLAQAGKLMDERIVVKERMRALYEEACPGRDATVHTLAFRVLAIQDEVDAIYGQKRFFDDHGYLPDDAVPAEHTPDELMRLRNNYRTYVTKYEAKVRESESDQKSQQRLEEYRSKLFSVQTLIDALPKP